MRRNAIVSTGAAALALAAGISTTPAKAFEGNFFLDQHKAYFERAPSASVPSANVASAAVEPAPAPAPPAYNASQSPMGDRPGIDPGPLASAIPREIVAYDGGHPAGTIVISTDEKRLYYVLPDHQAIKYGVGVGRPGF